MQGFQYRRCSGTRSSEFFCPDRLRALDLGLYLGIGGIATFKNAGADKVAARLPLDRLLLETDAPFLAPTPYRGKRNEPAYIRTIAEHLATIKNVPVEEVAAVTTRNAMELFSIS